RSFADLETSRVLLMKGCASFTQQRGTRLDAPELHNRLPATHVRILSGRWRRFMTIKVSVAPKGMGLNDFVAMQEGLFADEGLDVEFDMNIFRGTQSSWKDVKYFERPQDMPFSEGRSVIQGACVWGSICNASAGMGKFVPDCYGISPWYFCSAGLQDCEAP